MTKDITTLAPDQAAAWFLGAILGSEQLAAETRARFEAEVKDLESYQAMNEAAESLARIKTDARAYFESQEPGVITTDWGKIGIQVRRTLTHSPAAVRELASSIADLAISETVNATDLKRFVGPLIKSGKAPADLMAQLEARATVKESKAFICEAVKVAEVGA
jgi:hypothetical protein